MHVNAINLNNLVQLCNKLSNYSNLIESVSSSVNKVQLEKTEDNSKTSSANCEELISATSELIKCKNKIEKLNSEKDVLKKHLKTSEQLNETKNEELQKLRNLEKEFNTSLSKLNDECENLQKQLSLQKDVSSYLAHHCKSLHKNLTLMQQQFSQLQTALEMSRINYDTAKNRLKSHETFLDNLKNLINNHKAKQSSLIEKIAEKDLEIEILTKKHLEFQCRTEMLEKVNNDLQEQIAYKEKVEDNFYKKMENSFALIERQAKLIDTEQSSNRQYREKLEKYERESICNVLEAIPSEENDSQTKALKDQVANLEASLHVEKARYEELCKQHDESLKSLHLKLYNLNREKEEESKKTVDKVCFGSSRFGLNLKKNLNSSQDEAQISRGNESKYFNVMNCSSDEDEEEAFSLIPKVLTNFRSNSEILNCCSEPSVGQLVNCFKCKNSYHKGCAESTMQMLKRKNSKFICATCKPPAVGARKKSLNIRTD